MEDHYSSEDEEVFFGSLAESEKERRRRFLGSNCNSPVTPRPARFNQASSGIQRSLPDVLGTANTSTPTQRPDGSGNKQSTQPQNHLPLDDSLDDIIILDASGHSNSVITLSDDESFIQNEETCSNKSVRAENVNGSMDKGSGSICEISKNSDTAEISKTHHEDFSAGKDIVSNSVLVEEKSLHESVINNSENGNSLSDYSSFTNFETNILQTSADNSCDYKSNVENISSSLVNEIDEFVGQITVGETHIIPNNPQSPTQSSGNLSAEEQAPETSNKTSYIVPKLSSNEPSELQISANIAEKSTGTSAIKPGKHTLDLSDHSNFEFSLNGVTDSILNISHGSSLPSPPDTHHSASQKSNLYEDITDISCDGEQISNCNMIIDLSNFDEKAFLENLHMSVDEVDFQRQRFSDNFVASSSLGNSINISQPSEYKSCAGGCISYSTAYDRTYGENQSTTEKYISFQNYRHVSTDSDIGTEMDAVSIKSNEENSNEANFEMVMHNRQNSFNGTPVSKKSENNNEQEKSKMISKLPVYQNSKCLLRPAIFCAKPDTLKTSSYKFAKQISKAGSEQNSSNRTNLEISKIPGTSTSSKNLNIPSTKEKKIPLEKEKTFTKVPSKITTPKQNTPFPKPVFSLTKRNAPQDSLKASLQAYFSGNKTPTQNVNKSPAKSAVNRTPAQNKSAVKKTPAQNKSAVNRTPAQTISGIPRAVKSDTKVNMTPSRYFNTNESSAGKTIPTKNKFKNIISPIQAYIRGSPPVSQRKAQIISEEEESPEERQSRTQHVSSVKSAPRAVQKLKYENVEGQENVNPNVIDPSRDTLPYKILQPSLEVFWKEREQPQPHLPKMGEKMTKILAGTPKVKVTVHEGRVNQSPISKGILIPNNENASSTSDSTSDTLTNVDSMPSEQSHGRISVRMQKTIELP